MRNKKYNMTEFEDYKKEKLTINLIWANIFGILILIPIVLIYGIPFFYLWNSEWNTHEMIKYISENNIVNIVWKGLFIFIIGIVVHELIHGIVWSKFAKNGFKSIKFGVLWKMLTPYCHCTELLKVKHYIWGAITPAIILGFIPAVIAMFTGNIWILTFGMIFTMAACGDFLIINLLRKENPNNYVEDHPSEAGCFIYRKLDEK